MDEEVLPVSSWKCDLVNEFERVDGFEYKPQKTFWLWDGQVTRDFMLDRYFTANDRGKLSAYIKKYGKQTAKVLEDRRKEQRKKKRHKLALEWLSAEYGIEYYKLYQRYHRGDRGQALIRGNRKRADCDN